MAETPDENQAQFIKGKRTKRTRPPSVASSSSADCSSSSAGLTEQEEEDQDLANCLILLAQGRTGDCASVLVQHNQSLFAYQCKTCDRCFPSFQALGGHRASHKKPKISNSLQTHDPQFHLSLQLSTGRPPASFAAGDVVKSKVHECSICGAEFSSGQALGGHMRRHRALTSTASVASRGATATPQLQELMIKKERNVLELDLNLPAPEDDRHRTAVAVFSAASSLVDCHY
ncbi:zinc finger protein ZAT5-like [Cucurbita maxima]|uniref:Zinc finger protein ZAT5-like n=1 Tax=Cucurbita maxima TaxID=3661 RepID=A0A6J1KUK8_CUCMA|nr:zinc finger protein ZAT5-like [Cucurbita maxima]